MPRYRFQWRNLPPSLLAGLQRDLRLDEDVVAALTARYGARPKPTFIADAWPTLLEEWLTSDDGARTELVQRLQEAGIGATEPKPRTHDAEMRFLKGRRSSKTLRAQTLALLLPLGEEGRPPVEVGMETLQGGIWQVFQRHLADVLSVMPAGSFLILLDTEHALEDEQGHRLSYFVQFAQGGRLGFRAEVSGNRYLPRELQLPGPRERQLTALGWMPPDPKPRGPRDDVNHYREWPEPVPISEVAQLATATLREVLSLSSPEHLEYSAFDERGQRFLLPTLGIATKEDIGGPQPELAMGVDDFAELRGFVESVLRDFLGNPGLTFGEGDRIGITVGSAVMFVRLVNDPPHVQVFSPVLEEVPLTPELLQAINGLNLSMAFGRAFWVEGSVIVAVDLIAETLRASDVTFACQMLGGLADHVDDSLFETFGGRLGSGERREAVATRTRQGYL